MISLSLLMNKDNRLTSVVLTDEAVEKAMLKNEDDLRLRPGKTPLIMRLGANETVMIFGPLISRRAVSMITSDNNYLKLLSRPYQQRIAFIPVSVALILAWLIMITALVFLLTTHAVPSFYSFVAMAAGVNLGFMTTKYIEDSQQQYELQIHNEQLSLSRFDSTKNTCTRQQISLRELISAEYFTPKDSSSLFLRGKNNDVEIPLWTFGPAGEDRIIDYIRAHGIKTIDMPSAVPN